MVNGSGIRRDGVRAVALATLLLPLALIAGCGDSTGSGGSGGGDGAGEGSTSPSSAPSASQALTAAQLDKLSLAASDLKGFLVKKPGAAEALTQDDVRTGEEECAPVSQVIWGVALGDPAVTAQRRVTSEPDDEAIDAADSEAELDAALAVTSTTVSLASYDSPEQARTAFESLTSGIADCDGGFQSGAIGTGGTGKVTADTTPKAGDEAVAFTATLGENTDLLGPTKAVVFRRGSTLAQFSTVNPNAGVSDADFDVPSALIEAQEGKLG